MSRKPPYWVQFVGYSAIVFARAKYGRGVEYATLDFVSGSASVMADEGFVMAPKRADLEPFLKVLPKLANELQDRCHREDELSQQTKCPTELTSATDDMIKVFFGQNVVFISPTTKINGFIQQVTRRFKEIEQLLEPAEKIGLGIQRRPYDAHLDEIGTTGIARVEAFGFAFLVDGKLVLQPDYRVMFVRETGRAGTLEIQPADPTSKSDDQPISEWGRPCIALDRTQPNATALRAHAHTRTRARSRLFSDG